jgi:di/tricarboxylate transporter
MTFEIGFLFAVLAGMVYLFLTEKIPVDLTAFLGLVVLVFAGYVKPTEAFSGFSSSAVITMLSIFIVSASLLHTGVADRVGARIHRWVGAREIPLVVTLMVAAGLLSAFMNNIAATAVLMPAVASLCRQAEIQPARLFMPLAFGAILGGTTTLVGTPPNILVAEMLRDRGLKPFTLFDFTPLGLVLLGCGVLYMVTFGRRLLPDRGPDSERKTGDRAPVREVQSRLFSIHVPDGSPMDGKDLRDLRLGTALGVQVVATVRNDRRRLAPDPETVLAGGDELLVEGRFEDLRELLRVQGVEVERIRVAEVPRPSRGVSGVRARLTAGSPLAGRSLRELRFRDRFGLVVLGIRRNGGLFREGLAEMALREGDRLLALGTREQVDELAAQPDFEVREVGMSAVQQLQDDLYLIRLPESSFLAGKTVAESRLGELAGLTVAGIVREDTTRLGVSPDDVLQPGDRLLVTGEPSRIVRLLELGDIRLDPEVSETHQELESAEVGVAEAVVAPRSSIAGRTPAELRFRDRYGLQILSLWRQGKPVRTNLAHLALQFGDSLLLQGPHDRIHQIAADLDFVVLTEAARQPRRPQKAVFALGGLALMVGLVVAGLQPIHVAAFTAAALVVLFGALTMQEAYRAVEWRAIFLVAAILPVGQAMERSGAAELLAQSVIRLSEVFGSEGLGGYVVLAALVVLSSLLSQGLDGAPAVVLLFPVVTRIAEDMSLSPDPFMMGIGLAASAAFMTPFSHKANLLVMGAGGYRSMDYVRVGTPLTVGLLLLMVLLVPVFFPFHPG